MRIAILYDVWEGTEEYPGAAAEEAARSGSKSRKKKKRNAPKLDRDEIHESLEKLGHEPFFQVLDGTDNSLAALRKVKADLFFNLTESYAGDDSKDVHLAAFLDLLGFNYTGSGPQGLLLAQDKVLAKKIFRFHDIHTPIFAVIYKGQLDHVSDLGFPLIVKPTNEDGSIGIDSGAVVRSLKELLERIHYIHEEFDSPALLEEYIEGREIYAAVIGNEKPQALPLIELDLSQLPDGTPKIAGYDVKFDRDSEAYKKTKSDIADLEEETIENIQQTAVDAYRAMRLRDYGRIDMRLRDDGKVYVIEANPNPWLSSSAEFMMAAKESGRSYTQTIGDIIEHAVSRTRLR